MMIKKTLLLCFGLVLMSSCGASQKLANHSNASKNNIHKVKNKPVAKKKEVTVADKIIWSAYEYRGTPYKYAGTTKSGMDCSGLIYTSFKERDIILPRSSGLMYKEGYKIPLNKAKRGDLVFFKTTNKTKSKINHVAIVTRVDHGVVKFIHSTSSRGVIESSMTESYWKKAFIEAKRVL